MIPERIEREIVIEAPLDVVWATVTEPDHVRGWFSDAAEIDLRPGGDAVFTWHGHGRYRARIVMVEPPRAFAFRWVRRPDSDPTAGNETLVELTLVAEGTNTRLRVVESGFPTLAWPETDKEAYAQENALGWDRELAELRQYVSTRIGSPGTQ